jgi:protein-tyrosine phosphatase
MKVLFVCTGNLCRSPAAEKMLLHSGGGRFAARSRGTAAQAYTGMPRQVHDFLEGMGITDIAHKPALVSEADIDWADVILVMENYHLEALAERFPQSSRKTRLFLDYCTGSNGRELPDPMGKSDRAFNKVLAEIRKAIELLVNKRAAD